MSIVADDPALKIRVRDDGVGLPADWSFERDAGVGLRNVADRLEHIYGTAEPAEAGSGSDRRC